MLSPPHSPKVFNHPQRFIKGWYWLLRSKELKRGQVKSVFLLGRDLAIYRTNEEKVVAMDAHCPHMGAHLAEGKVEGESLRCFFHNWQFDSDGQCLEVPCLGKALPVKINTWPVTEAYGLIWLWTGDQPSQPIPFPPELVNQKVSTSLGRKFTKACHPNVVMVNAIDAHHFNTVHNFPVEINFKAQVVNQNVINFENITKGGNNSLLVRLIKPFYREAGTYNLSYWFGSTGMVTIGPDFLHFYIMFTLRLGKNGQTEGQTVLLTKYRPGPWGWLSNGIILWLTSLVGNYFAKGDTKIFQTIKFALKTPIAEDRPILEFIHHAEQQPSLNWQTWQTIDGKKCSANGLTVNQNGRVKIDEKIS
ncbi:MULTISPECIES: aromatic ring-hydroxylating dioxygenase subunit alpha [unclassified Synechocystis]|uniref:aromatic ring-hydroxylating dioxygenase subunit alpha n=1 Tax=unclassified Synechocystis TaxID=2640012 RepID=UPI0004D1BFAA|nr:MULTISPECIES: aromatic ring-hydroxylating dioxygenase subunit alpha [unclassified Synechocystis]AIE74824.1 Aminopyrrolnitrin oxidase PrnD [Synechocystis sp. PCC 6714]